MIPTAWRGEEEVERGKREVERGRGEVEWEGRKREKKEKKKRKRRNAIMLPAHWIASFLDLLSPPGFVLQVGSEALGTRLTF